MYNEFIYTSSIAITCGSWIRLDTALETTDTLNNTNLDALDRLGTTEDASDFDMLDDTDLEALNGLTPLISTH